MNPLICSRCGGQVYTITRKNTVLGHSCIECRQEYDEEGNLRSEVSGASRTDT